MNFTAKTLTNYLVGHTHSFIVLSELLLAITSLSILNIALKLKKFNIWKNNRILINF